MMGIAGFIMIFLTDKRANKKLDHITVLTNSTLTLANKTILELEAKVVALEQTVAELEARLAAL